MANKILILGHPGSGKTSSARDLDPKSTFIICPDEKALPFRGWKNNYKTTYGENGKIDLANTNLYHTTSPQVIKQLLKAISEGKPETKVVLIDTITSLMISEMMKRMGEKCFEKFNDFASDVYSIIKMIDGLRKDLTVIVVAHVEENYDAEGSLRVSFMVPGGKLLKEKIKQREFSLLLSFGKREKKFHKEEPEPWLNSGRLCRMYWKSSSRSA